MKLKVLGACALTLAFALAGAPAASASPAYVPPATFYLVTYINGHENCVSNAVQHTSYVFLTSHYPGDCMPMELINPYTFNGNPWFELEMLDNSNCLNNVLAGQDIGIEFSDSCPKGDYNELWYNKYNSNKDTAFENLEGNSSADMQTYLQPIYDTKNTTEILYASIKPYSGWDLVGT
jgi:hypothetical protein